MQVEYVAGVRLTSRGALQQETQRTVGYRVLGKVVVNYQDVLAVVHEELAHCAAGVGCDVLKRCGVAGGCALLLGETEQAFSLRSAGALALVCLGIFIVNFERSTPEKQSD